MHHYFSAVISRKIQVLQLLRLILRKGDGDVALGLMLSNSLTSTHLCAVTCKDNCITCLEERNKKGLLCLSEAMKGVRWQPVSRPIGVTGVCCCVLLVLLAITVVTRQDVSSCPLPEAPLWSHSRRAYDASSPLAVHSPTPQPRGPD